MGILFTVIVVALLIAQLITSVFLRFEEGSPAKDKDILELFEKKGEQYDRVTTNWDDVYSIENWRNSSAVPKIEKNSKWWILYPYTIQNVGVVPRWYKSKKVIDAKFAELLKDSKYNTNKRKKLGLE